MADGMGAGDDAVPDGPMALHCFVKRRDGLSHEEFLDYWRNHHGPLIRDTPELARWTKRYVQHAAHPKDSSGYDGVAVQEFASWDDFIAMITGPAGELMRNDEANFLSQKDIAVVFTTDPVVMIETAEDT
jgi:uncharacterized protein (TIGR02118 family)